MKKYPFKFLDSYNKEDKDIFFGRDEEVNTLYEMVFQSTIMLIYGGSGTGKTSLINCGLASKFQPHDWLALMIRRGNNINDSLQQILTEQGGRYIVKQDDLDWDDEFSNDTLLSPVGTAIQDVYHKSFRPIYLIFDQFEELFILGTGEEQRLFIKTVLEILESKQPVKMIFSIREEYLGYLFDFEQAVPQLLKKKLRVEPMNLNKIKEVIIGASKFTDSNISIKEGEEDLVAEGIFNKIKGKEKARSIELPFLQVFLDKFYMKITGDATRKAEAEFSLKFLNEMGEIDDILIDFLEEQVSEISNKLIKQYPLATSEMIWKILSPFSTLEGTKEPITKKHLRERLPNIDAILIDKTIESFENSRILRFNESTDFYEIAHDALAKPIAAKRSIEEKALLEIKRLIKSQVTISADAREYFSDKQLQFIEPYLNKITLNEEELNWIHKSEIYNQEQKNIKRKEQTKKRRDRIKWISVVGFLILLLTIIFLVNKEAKIRSELKQNLKEILFQEELNQSLRLIIEGSERYPILNDSTMNRAVKDTLIAKFMYMEKSYPIDSLIIPRASRSPSNGKNFNYVMWIDVPSFRRHEIKEVHYKFCKDFIDPLRFSNEPNSSFSIGYLGWGACPTINIDIILKNGDILKRDFQFIKYLKDRGLWKDQ